MTFWLLLKKELMEIVRTHKLYVVPGLFVFFGFLSPILTKMMPDLLEMIAGDVEIVLPAMTAADAFLQLFKNWTQIGIIAVILTTMGTVAEEKSRGTLLLVAVRPVRRLAIVAAKFVAASLLVVVATVVSYGAALYYTVVLFDGVPVLASMQALLLFLVYMMFIVAVTVSASTLMRSQVAAGGLALLGFFVVSLIAALGDRLVRVSPGGLATYANWLVTGKVVLADATWALVVTGVLVVCLVIGAGISLNRQEL